MKMLAVSTSAKLPSAAILLDDRSIALSEDKSGRPHSVSLMHLVDDLLNKNGIEPSEIDIFAVDVGPGSFTGVRIGVSIVNAMAYALSKPVIAVPSLCALRHLSDSKEQVVAMLDARNGNGYAAAFQGESCILEPCACVQSEIIENYCKDAELVGDCCGRHDQSNAKLVILEALAMLQKNDDDVKVRSAVPLYLRPSQAERMKKTDN
ncbi:MAG: tRNA (adenosine(37)-N6)-threonylcarbamoyltransferase complex dimerization subunit type 1 TsaB [Clostridia bacterium]|nr:tRNA (adenosine(37)-N6)-threonylcarbamoyltransferase complex dimerization subunit type 1 TsaB [Clostridia bacterium]